MEYGIQRRNIYLAPPSEADIEWFCAQFERREVWEMFGMEGPSPFKMLRSWRGGDSVVGILHRVTPRKRIGFVVMFPPDAGRDFWEFGYAIEDPADRDAFSAMYSTDAMAHYMFEHLHVDAMGWRTRSDNYAAAAIIRRLGYVPFETVSDERHSYTKYRLDREGWMRRRAKLDRGEESHPSGLGATFLTLREFPFEPVPLPQDAAPSAAPEAPGEASPEVTPKRATPKSKTSVKPRATKRAPAKPKPRATRR